MYIYHALINALSAHMIHINLNMIFYTHAEQSPTKTIYINYYIKNTNKMHYTHTHTHTHAHTHTHTDCSRNWVTTTSLSLTCNASARGPNKAVPVQGAAYYL